MSYLYLKKTFDVIEFKGRSLFLLFYISRLSICYLSIITIRIAYVSLLFSFP